ncbi:phosphate acyltransferase PlsX [bacterium]|nr:phosphate acyltransferase PlsX [bacterium]
MRIAVDVMGGDHGPEEILKGVHECLLELKQEDISCILVGCEDHIKHYDFTDVAERVSCVATTDVFGMNDKPTKALKPGMDYSITKAAKLVKEGKADAMLSAGNTGASIAVSLILWGKIKECKKPGIAIKLPGIKSSFIMMDMGAIVDAKPVELLQFAKMAKVFAVAKGVVNPTIALLSNGEEEKKGNSATREAYRLFKDNIDNFKGYVEGHALFLPKYDIVICDGFNGNIVLKTSEGIIRLVFALMEKELATLEVDENIRKMLCYKLSKKLDYNEYGGAIVLGVNGINIIAHGSSKGKAIKNGIKQAFDYYKLEIVEKMKSELATIKNVGDCS